MDKREHKETVIRKYGLSTRRDCDARSAVSHDEPRRRRQAPAGVCCARTVSIVLTLAIIACPIWCGNGLCHAGQCSSAQQSAPQPCPDHEAASCCGDEGSSESNDDCPCDAFCKSSCQGVCGGAVFEKPCEFNDGTDSAFLPLIAAETPVACQLAEWRTLDGDHFLDCGGNHGRSLRTLYMSLLC